MIGLGDRRGAICRGMVADGIEALLVAGSGLHLIDQPDPVAHLVGFRSLGEAVAVLRADGGCVLLVSPREDQARATLLAEDCSCIGADDLPRSLAALGLPRAVAWVGLEAMAARLAEALIGAAGTSRGWDGRFDLLAAIKTGREIAAARRACAIAEAGYRELLARAKAGLRECDLAVEINLRMKALGADDGFLMLNCLPRAPAVMPSSERVLREGDLILVELSPCVDGQFVQICRTAALGEPPLALREDYRLLCAALGDGIASVRPGAQVAAICDAIDARMADAGYAAYSRPPHLRRRGHGLGCGSIAPGDIAFDNRLILEEDMLFVVHPNQFLPNSGYLMCGETLRVTAGGCEVLGAERAALSVIAP
jgi:Xaa-Pro dipeptidase